MSLADISLELQTKAYLFANDPKARKKYNVDVLAGWLYYTPTYGLQEALLGNDLETIISTRAIGLGVHAAVMRPVGKIRNYVAQKMQVTKESPIRDQIKVNFIGITPIQAVAYGLMIYSTGAFEVDPEISNMNELQKITYRAIEKGANFFGTKLPSIGTVTWVAGTVLGAIHSVFAGPVQDKVRKYFGVEQAIKESS